ncbi:8-oxoguanine DNA glycosylase OGG fold protein [Streptomyces bobili]
MKAAEMTLMPAGASVPHRADVLGQAIPFDRARWLPLLPSLAWWPAELDDCPTVAGRRRVDRSTVFGISRRSDTVEGRRHLLTAALVWGAGTKAQSVARRARIFTRSSAGEIDARLEAGLGALREAGAVQAYYAFNNAHRIKFLGPAFFTKVLYFAGHEQCVGALRPLILDRLVARSLRAADNDGKWRGAGWTTRSYGRYLSLAHDHAQQAGVLPDQVEAALFARGKQLLRPT